MSQQGYSQFIKMGSGYLQYSSSNTDGLFIDKNDSSKLWTIGRIHW